MKKIIITFTLVLFNCIGLLAQSTSEPKCTLTVDEIAMAQPFHLDHPKQEEVQRIANIFITEISTTYKLINNKELSKIDLHRNTIKLAINQANEIGMNYSMFKADIDFIDSIIDKK